MDHGLRIAHVQPLSIDLFGYRDDDWGTTFRYFLPNMAAAQAARGDHPTVHLLSVDGRRSRRVDDLVEGVRVVFHPCVEPRRRGGVQRRFSRQFSVSMLRSLRSEDVDVIHFHGVRSMHLMLGATAMRAQQRHVALVAQDHGPRSVGPVMRRVQLEAIRRCDALLPANSESHAELLAKAPSVEVHTVANGVDPLVFHPDRNSTQQRGPCRVLVVSRLMPDKDPLTMADSIVELARRGHPVELTVVGNGELRSEVERRLRLGSVPVTFIDKLAQPELAVLYRTADVLLLTSLREGFNQATLEAMASGTPVVASDIAGIRDGVADAGLLVPPGQTMAFTDRLELLATDQQAWSDHRARSLEQARRFTWPMIADDLDALYRRAIALRSRRWSSPTG